jgi:hypothetical protein
LKLAVFHYHLLPGGVTSVITLSLQAVVSYIEEIEEVVLVSGREDNLDTVQKSLGPVLREKGCSLSGAVLPEIGYTDEKEAAGLGPEKLKAVLRKRFEGYIWWVHNYHIGKNPVFTRSIIELADEYPEQPVLFHIHDFPESARYGNLRFIRQHYSGPLYPTGNNIWYSVINSRDYRLLLDAGLPEQRVVLLQNPVSGGVSVPRLDAASKKAVTAKLETYSRFRAGAPSLLYPVRSIRRKNVLEAGLMAELTPPGVNLLLTLPGTSEQERPYSDLVSRCFRRGLIRGAFPTADEVDFHTIIAYSDAIVSSSVQEGFGYLFINTIQWQKPLAARDLDIMDDFTPFFHAAYHHLYREVSIPRDFVDVPVLKDAYFRFIGSYSRYLSDHQRESLAREADALGNGPVIGFSYLSPDMQEGILALCGDSGVRFRISEANRPLLDRLRLLLDTAYSTPLDAAVHETFGFEGYARKCASVFSAMEAGGGPAAGQQVPAAAPSADSYIFDFFVKLENFRLLYAPYPPSRTP